MAWSQTAPSAPPEDSAQLAPWTLGASFSGYFFHNEADADYFEPILTIDHSLLHIEARYQYEALHTGSLWMGLNFSWGKEVELSLTPMFGGVFGAQAGIALTAEATLSWSILSLTANPELVVDFKDTSQNNFNAYSELIVHPWSWLDFGLALQRTRAHTEKVYIAFGPFVGFTVWKVSLLGYWFNPFSSSSRYFSFTLSLNGLQL